MTGLPQTRMSMKRTRIFVVLHSAVMLTILAAGCDKNRQVEEALNSDANGYLCLKCTARFYTDRDVFASHCPQCKAPNIEMAIGFVCEADKHVTYGARGRGTRACEQCGKVTSALSLPRESDLKAWGATRRGNADVN